MKITRKNKFKLIFSVLVILLMISFLLPVKSFAGFGISPSDIVNGHLKPGDHYEKTIIISRSDPTEDLTAVVDVDFEGIDQWFTFDPGQEFTLPKGEKRFPLKIVIDVPEDAPVQKYTGSIRIKAMSPEEQKSGVSIVKGAKVQVALATTELDVVDLLIRSMKITPAVDGEPVILTMNIENVGNKASAPTKVNLIVYDLADNEITKATATEIKSVEPGKTQEVSAEFYPDVDPGEYFGVAKVYLGDNVIREAKMYFKVNEKPVVEENPTQTITSTEISVPTYVQYVQNNMYMLLGVGAIILLLLLILIIVLIKKNPERHVNAIHHIPYIIFIFILLYMVYAIVIMYTAQELIFNTTTTISPTTDTSTEYKGEENVVDESKTPTDEVVKGAETEATRNVPTSTLFVAGPENEGIYYIYSKPDLNSKVVYEAKDGEELDVFDEQNGWYGILLPDGTSGWINAENVKSVNDLANPTYKVKKTKTVKKTDNSITTKESEKTAVEKVSDNTSNE